MSDYSAYVQRIRKQQQEVLNRKRELLRQQQKILAEVVEFASKMERCGCILHYEFPGDNPQVPIVTLSLGGALPRIHVSAVLAGGGWGLAVFQGGSESSQKVFEGEKCYEEAFNYLADLIADQTAELLFLQERQE